MSNELTILRFYGATSAEVPPVSPEALNRITDGLIDVATTAAHRLAFDVERVGLHFAVAPRKGSLEIVLVQTVEILGAPRSPLGAELLDRLGDLAGVGAFIWTVVFGGRGILELVRGGLPETAAPTDDLEVLRIRVRDHIYQSNEIKKAARQLLDTAILPRVTRTEIEVFDEPAVVLFASDDRTQPTLLARSRRPGPNRIAGQGIKHVAYLGGPVIRAIHKNQSVKVFLGSGTSTPRTVGHNLVIVWASEAPLPKKGAWMEAKAEELPDDALKKLVFEDSIPFEFEEAEGVLLVTRTALWR